MASSCIGLDASKMFYQVLIFSSLRLKCQCDLSGWAALTSWHFYQLFICCRSLVRIFLAIHAFVWPGDSARPSKGACRLSGALVVFALDLSVFVLD